MSDNTCKCGICAHNDLPLIERLRQHVGSALVNETQAAAEIERLEAENTRQRLRFSVERQRLETEIARLLGELRILDAAGRINRKVSDE